MSNNVFCKKCAYLGENNPGAYGAQTSYCYHPKNARSVIDPIEGKITQHAYSREVNKNTDCSLFTYCPPGLLQSSPHGNKASLND